MKLTPQNRADGDIHITPRNDLKPHAESRLCKCRPILLYENGKMLVIHDSYDGREFFEKREGH